MSQDEQEPLMYDARADEAISLLLRQLARLVAHHNDEALHIDAAQVELHLPAYAMTQRRDLLGMVEG